MPDVTQLEVKPARTASPRIYRTRRAAAAFIILLLFLIGLKSTVAMSLAAGRLPLAYAYVPSPNYDDRPFISTINCIVLHATVEPTIDGTEGIFLDRRKKVSAHFVVGKDGRVVQMVPVEKRAWHAGISVLEGEERVNDYSVGIEMVNLNDGLDPYPPAQVEAVAGLIRFIRSRYNVPDERIVSHAQVALPAGRKSDPAGFDFDLVRRLARVVEPVSPDRAPQNGPAPAPAANGAASPESQPHKFRDE